MVSEHNVSTYRLKEGVRLMKKVFLILIAVLVMVALVGGITPVFATGGANASEQISPLCDEWLMGAVAGKSGNAANGTITLASQGGGGNIAISVNSDTKYRAWLNPAESVTFESLAVGDWIAVCIKSDLAKLVVLLKPPQIPYCLRLAGNVTSVSNGAITVTTGNSSSFTISGIDTTGLAVGQPVRLTIGKCVPFLGQCFPGLHLGWFIGKGNQGVGPWFKNKDFSGKLEQFRERYRDRFEQRFQRWQERFGGNRD